MLNSFRCIDSRDPPSNPFTVRMMKPFCHASYGMGGVPVRDRVRERCVFAGYVWKSMTLVYDGRLAMLAASSPLAPGVLACLSCDWIKESCFAWPQSVLKEADAACCSKKSGGAGC